MPIKTIKKFHNWALIWDALKNADIDFLFKSWVQAVSRSAAIKSWTLREKEINLIALTHLWHLRKWLVFSTGTSRSAELCRFLWTWMNISIKAHWHLFSPSRIIAGDLFFWVNGPDSSHKKKQKTKKTGHFRAKEHNMWLWLHLKASIHFSWYGVGN